ncbi:MAG: hypothetical protein H6553_06790 [Chitinophagales bacterium]|nr:hypothetical protein [Chitinophagales bacterium]
MNAITIITLAPILIYVIIWLVVVFVVKANITQKGKRKEYRKLLMKDVNEAIVPLFFISQLVLYVSSADFKFEGFGVILFVLKILIFITYIVLAVLAAINLNKNIKKMLSENEANENDIT